MASRSLSQATSPSPTALRTRLAEIDDEMDALKSRLRVLAVERRRVTQGLGSIIYPVLTLPPGVTSQIFYQYVEEPYIGHTRTPGRGHGPLTLASVCRSWRDLCLSLPSLWASLRIYPDTTWPIDNFLRFLQCWLERAGNCPLALHIFGSGLGSMSMKIFSSISRFSTHFQTLSLTLDRPFAFPNAEIRGQIPLLTKLVVNIITERDTPVLMTAFTDAPSLREVQLSGTSFEWISLPWIQLTKLEFTEESVSSCVEILKETPNLEVLVVYLSDQLHPQGPSIVTLPRLHTLEFLYDPMGMLLDHLRLPGLKRIHLTSLDDHGEGVSRFLALGDRSTWSLQSIHFAGMMAERYLPCLRSLSSLEEVEIRLSWDCSSDEPPGELMELLRDDSTFLPALRALTLREWPRDISASSFAEMLAARRNRDNDQVAKLESFQVFFSPERDY
ncbi:hypothetical protein B0H19DRAFT_94840 [Mycena capillaripes]|nr:hypothetical protein B0H19DRAFT_94840 [Mycena capillaripes]